MLGRAESVGKDVICSSVGDTEGASWISTVADSGAEGLSSAFCRGTV